MAIYEPVSEGAGIYSGYSVGKDAPFYSPIKGYKINLASSRGKAGAFIRGGKYVYDFVKRHPYFTGGAASAAAGYVAGNAAYNKKRQALFSSRFNSNRKWRSRKRSSGRRNSRRCCSCQCV